MQHMALHCFCYISALSTRQFLFSQSNMNSMIIVNSVNQSTKNRIDVLENSDAIIAINIRIVYKINSGGRFH
jgi:hypothetical protein